ncbi:HEAT repeat domain-containing protein [Actinoplanes bogorensis]|uniref:HEAT repeat domain-containing protein n=1 Tax=Paractinoplanes bogorensis TaxID=1610840 RepID=A0ABS5YNU4_9ACTN|nr:HEAT repeat domain-containing protein [Actinoplanes bogorensis]MBU2665125.1 HEAT repeat domain-containing protein [Actinoplanes bogorensis]
MFDGLDDVNWHDLPATYGSAAGVPAKLRATMSPDPEVRRRALSSCDGDLVHQGHRNDCAPPAIPFLLEILAHGHPDLRSDLLEALLMLAVGYDETWLPETFAADRATPIEVACHAAVERGVPQFTALVQDPDSPVRRYAAALLGWFPACAATSVPALMPVVDDPDPSVAATAVLALGLLGSDHFSVRGPALVRGAAAIARARVHGPAAGPEVTAELLRWVSGEAEPLGTEIPYYEGNLHGYATLALGQVLPDDSDEAFETLLARIPQVQGMLAVPVVAEALRRAFPDGPRPPGSALNPRQQRLVHVLTTTPAIGELINLSAMVDAFVVPDR